jgi:two-component system cell cycle response regulator
MTEKVLRMILAEDSNGRTAEMLRNAFPETKTPLDLTVVSTPTTLLPTIKVTVPEILVLDLLLARPNALDTVRRLHRSAPGVPLIVIAEEGEEELARSCLKEGAIDYLVKGSLSKHKLAGVVREALEKNTLTGLTDFLRDPLTGHYIREGFMAMGSGNMEKARKSGGTLVLLCAVLDSLPAIKKNGGTRAGEDALQDLGELLTGGFRRTDIIARLGEAEFAALAVDATEPSVAVLRQRVEKHLEVFNHKRGTRGLLEIRLSAGHWEAPDPRTFEEFLEGIESTLGECEAINRE